MTKTENLGLNVPGPEDPVSAAAWGEDMRALDERCAQVDAMIADVRSVAEELPYVMGSYQGVMDNQTITLPFRPRFVIIFQTPYAGNTIETALGGISIFGATGLFPVMAVTDKGFSVNNPSYTNYLYPSYNTEGKTYYYIAFR